jgi:hypothetical protein
MFGNECNNRYQFRDDQIAMCHLTPFDKTCTSASVLESGLHYVTRSLRLNGDTLLGLVFVIWMTVFGEAFAQADVKASSGHHYSFLEGAQIGHDFGRNPFARNPSDASLGFSTSFGRSRLRQGLSRAVEAGETRMSFDLGFDFRSVVLFVDGQASGLDDWAIENVDAFVEEVEAADEIAQRAGRRFAADVVLVDHAVADGVSQEGAFAVGEHPELIADTTARARWLEVLAPVLAKLVTSDRITINLMNEPEFVSMSALEAAMRIRNGRLGEARLISYEGGLRKVSVGVDATDNLAANPEQFVRVTPRNGGAVDLSFTQITNTDLRLFLVDLWRAVIDATTLRGDFDNDGRVSFEDFLVFAGSFGLDAASPGWNPVCDLTADREVGLSDFLIFADDFGRIDRRPEITIGWVDDLSALDNTPVIEALAADVVTDVISFHVYDVDANRFHPLTTTRNDFNSAGYGDRSIRISEWGLGRRDDEAAIIQGVSSALGQARSAGYEGILFWWDSTHDYGYEGFRLACE